MTTEEKNTKIKEITSQILKLKELGPSIETKSTIQKLQQQLGNLTSN